jgi:hypothetical protein
VAEHQVSVGIAGIATAVEASCARVGVTPETGFHDVGKLLAAALGCARRGDGGADAEVVARSCFEKIRRDCQGVIRIGGSPAFPRLVEEALLAIGWLAELAASLSDPTGRQTEAAQNCVDACVRLHVFTGARGSDVLMMIGRGSS